MTTATGPDMRVGQKYNGSKARLRPEDWGGPQERRRQGPLADPTRMARALGWFSIGLGLAEVAAPRRLARFIGVEDDDTHRNFLLAYGLREIAAGVAILAADRPTTAVWARVGGDVMDLAFLGEAMTSNASGRSRAMAATAAVLGVTVLDVLTGRRLGQSADWRAEPAAQSGAVQVRESVTVSRPPEEVYRFWRNFEHLPEFMEHLESVQVLDDRHSHWRARAPAGSSVEWDAEIVDDQPNERISWRSVSNADVPNMGSVRFVAAPGGRGTEIHVELRYDPPGGKAGALVAKLFGEEPSQQVKSDLRRLKQVLETGEVVHSDASVHRGMHPAQPSAEGGTDR
ncbi:MAG: SRPBCC family protein [Gemmatimonadales bacterium]